MQGLSGRLEEGGESGCGDYGGNKYHQTNLGESFVHWFIQEANSIKDGGITMVYGSRQVGN